MRGIFKTFVLHAPPENVGASLADESKASGSSIRKYLREIEQSLKAGNATEHTHRPALKKLIETLRRNVTATNEPRRIECGAPDSLGLVLPCKSNM